MLQIGIANNEPTVPVADGVMLLYIDHYKKLLTGKDFHSVVTAEIQRCPYSKTWTSGYSRYKRKYDFTWLCIINT